MTTQGRWYINTDDDDLIGTLGAIPKALKKYLINIGVDKITVE